MNRSVILLAAVAFLIGVFVNPAAAEERGGTILVTSRSDAPDSNPGDGFCDDGNGDCGLRAAVMEANETEGADEILIFVAGTAAFNLSTQINVTDDVTILGASSAITRIDGGGQARLFNVTSARLTLEKMTLREGNAGISNGGAILTNNSSQNLIVLRNVVVKNNEANNGGGLFILGNMTLVDSIIENNRANASGGGINNTLSSSTTIVSNSIIRNNTAGSNVGGVSANGLRMTNSAVHNNSADGSAGGLRLGSGNHSLTQVTVSSNSADSSGGIGISNRATLNLSNVTITNNESRGGGAAGIEVNGSSGTNGTITVRNSIIAGNYGSPPDCAGGVWASEGYNLVGLITAACSWAGDTDNDLFATAFPAIDPDLGTLQLNDHDSDGTLDETPTHVPNADSPAVNGANPSGCFEIGAALPVPMTLDQRGSARSRQGQCDIGSAESPHMPVTPPTAVAMSGQSSAFRYQPSVLDLIALLLLTVTTVIATRRESVVNRKS